jgi:hypothetical protein
VTTNPLIQEVRVVYEKGGLAAIQELATTRGVSRWRWCWRHWVSALSLHHQTTVPAVGLEASKPVRTQRVAVSKVAVDDAVDVLDIDIFPLVRPDAAVLVVDTVRAVRVGVGTIVVDERVIDGLIDGAGRAP